MHYFKYSKNKARKSNSKNTKTFTTKATSLFTPILAARAFARDGSIAVALGGSGVGASGVGNTIGTGIGTGITRGDMRASYFGDSYYGPGSLGVGSGKKGKKGGAAYSGLRSGYYSGGSVFGAGLGNVFPGPAWNPRMTPFGLGGGGRVFSNYYAGPTIGRSGMAFGGRKYTQNVTSSTHLCNI